MIRRILSKCIRVVRPGYLLVTRAAGRLCDNRLGITTGDQEVAQELGRVREQEGFYSFGAISFLGMERLMRNLEPSRRDVMLDLGCGAGRAICVAAQHPFSRVIGIEIDEPLSTLAKRNAHRLRRYTVRPEIVCADATTYRVPDDVTIVFLYNSFRGEVLKSALTRLLESFDRAPRRLRLVYANPREHELVVSMQRFRCTHSLRLSWRPEAEAQRVKTVRIYEVDTFASDFEHSDIAPGRASALRVTKKAPARSTALADSYTETARTVDRGHHC